MVGSIDPRREAHRRGHWRSDAAGVFGPRIADTILASGRVRPHPKGRTYDRKRSHPNPHQDPCKRGPSTYGPWPAPPDLNPIEMVFAKLKALFRKADMRTIEEAWRKIGSLLDLFPPTECAAYLRHTGYGSKTV